MTFRKDAFLYFQFRILCVILIVSSMSMISFLGFLFPGLLAFLFIVLFLCGPKIHDEFITINGTGICSTRKGELLWSYKWQDIAALKRSSRYRYPSVEVILYNESRDWNRYDRYFQLGKTARKAIEQYCNDKVIS